MIAWRVNATVTLLAAHGVQTPTLLAKENALRPLRPANEVALIQDKDMGSGWASGSVRRLGAKAWREGLAVTAGNRGIRPNIRSAEGECGWGGGRGSRIRTCDLQYPKLPRYQAALYPAPLSVAVGYMFHRPPARRPMPAVGSPQSGTGRYFLKKAPATRSPGAMPSLRAVPPMTSSTARTGPPDGMRRSESGSAFSAIRRMRPSARMKIMSRGM
jgi:hypothetical protein